jgi:hypothetical protein
MTIIECLHDNVFLVCTSYCSITIDVKSHSEGTKYVNTFYSLTDTKPWTNFSLSLSCCSVCSILLPMMVTL